MARVKNGILGGFSGKVGTVVGYYIGDEAFMRSLPKDKSFSAAELVNQDKFKLVTNYLEPLKELIKVGFKNYYTKTGGYRAAVSYTRKVALVTDDAGFYIDPALFKISGGELSEASNPAVEVADGHINISWGLEGVKKKSLSDQLMVLVYHPESFEALQWIYDGVFRHEQFFSIPYPEKFNGLECDVHIGFVAADRSSQSDSQYLGRISLPE